MLINKTAQISTVAIKKEITISTFLHLIHIVRANKIMAQVQLIKNKGPADKKSKVIFI